MNGCRTAHPRIFLLIILAVGVGAFALRLSGIDFGLPNVSRPDEERISSYALSTLSSWLSGQPSFPVGPKPLFVTAVAGLYGLSISYFSATAGISPQTLFDWYLDDAGFFHLVSRTFSALCGAVDVALVAGLAFALTRSRLVSLLSSLLLAVTYVHVRESHFGTSDATATSAITLCLWLSVLYCRTLSPWILRAACVSAAIATGFKLPAAICLIAVLMAHDIACQRRQAQGRAALTARIYFGGVLEIFLVYAVALVVVCPSLLLDPVKFFMTFIYEKNYFHAGHLGVDVGHGWWRFASFCLLWGLGPLYFIYALAGVLRGLSLVRGRKSFRGRLYLVPLAFVALYYVIVGSTSEPFVRFVLPLVPSLSVFAITAVVFAARRLFTRDRRLRLAFIGAALAPVVYYSLDADVKLDRLLSVVDTRTLARAWLMERLRPGDGVGVGPQFAHVELPRAYRKYLSGRGMPAVPAQVTDKPTVRNEFALSTYADVATLRRLKIAYVVVPRSQLSVYEIAEDEAQDIAKNCRLSVHFAPYSGAGPAAQSFDQLDGFFLPFFDMDKVSRPGPDIFIYAVPQAGT